MSPVRAALYLDFDNVFGGLYRLDPEAAEQFAEDPSVWVRRLQRSVLVDGPRRWLVLRCYLNPAGWVPNGDGRVYFSRFRPYFTRAGFEVVDCPRLTHTKNAADIRMVVDAVDAVSASTHYDEFVIASGDSDMTPLVVRLRAADRRTTIISPSDAAEAFTSIADRLVDAQQLLQLVQGEAVEEPETGPEEERIVIEADGTADLDRMADRDELERFRTLVTTRYLAAEEPINLATFAHQVRSELPAVHERGNWLGYGSFSRALQRMELPGLTFSQHYIWDETRHRAPNASGPRLPGPVQRVTDLLALPRLPGDAWPALYAGLASYAATHHFNLTEATRWTRDHLAANGVAANRAAVGFVVRGASFGGTPLHRDPPPAAHEIAGAFVHNLIDRAEAAGITLDEEASVDIRRWFGCPGDPAPTTSR
ncbi:MAG: NYN domain-containing protein [Friedmanniella sp.]|jgi:uncharacterized LabA/DUF88 family protein